MGKKGSLFYFMPKQKGDKNFFKKSVFPVCWLISAPLNEHAQRTGNTKANYFEYKTIFGLSKAIFFTSWAICSGAKPASRCSSNCVPCS